MNSDLTRVVITVHLKKPIKSVNERVAVVTAVTDYMNTGTWIQELEGAIDKVSEKGNLAIRRINIDCQP